MSPGSGSGVAALLRDYRAFAGARLWVALVLMLLGAVAEGFGLLMIVPLASIAMGSDTRLLGPVADWGNLLTPSQRLGVALALFVGAMAARSALLYARDLLIARLQTGYVSSLRLRAAATLARRGWTFASRVGQAGMQSLLLNDVPRAGVAVSYVEQFAIAAVMLLVQLALAALLSPTLTAAALLILAGGLLLSGGWTRRGVKSGLAMIERFEESTGSGFRMHAGLKAALAQGTVEQFLNEYDSSLDAARDEVVRFTSDVTLARSLAFLASAVAAAILMFVGVQLLALALPVLIASLVLFARMSGPAQSLQQGLQNVAAFAPSFAAIEARATARLARASAGECQVHPHARARRARRDAASHARRVARHQRTVWIGQDDIGRPRCRPAHAAGRQHSPRQQRPRRRHSRELARRPSLRRAGRVRVRRQCSR
jgi:ATP-binding cassette subfamily C protein